MHILQYGFHRADGGLPHAVARFVAGNRKKDRHAERRPQEAVRTAVTAVAEVDERQFEFAFQQQRGAERFGQFVIAVHRGHDLHRIRAAFRGLRQVFEHLFRRAGTLHVRRDHHIGPLAVNPVDQPLLLIDGGLIAGQFHRGGIVQVPHHVDDRSARVGGGEQHLLPGVVAEMLLRIVAVETEHERQPHRVDHPFERVALAEFRLQVPQVDRKAVRSFKFAIPRFGGQLRRRLPGEDSGDDRIGLVEKGSFHKRVLLFFL